MANTNKPATRDLFAEWAAAMFGDNVPPDEHTEEPAEETPEPENRPTPIGSAENYSPTPTRDLFAMMAHESMQNGFSDNSGLWRRII